jgi:hypothetical protein
MAVTKRKPTGKPQSQAMKLLTEHEEVDWYTPSIYIEAARRVMGGIELDPASSEIANQTVKAQRIFTIEDDGLAQPWLARSVFLNPPYGKTNNMSNQGLWTHKLIAEYKAGNVQQGIMLVNLYYGYDWFAPLRSLPMCLVDHRISFNKPDPNSKSNEAKASSIFLYLGPDFKRFKAVFKVFGKTFQPDQDQLEACPVCGELFIPKDWGGSAKEYCRPACKQKAYRLRIANERNTFKEPLGFVTRFEHGGKPFVRKP